jgi:hypothetical protein
MLAKVNGKDTETVIDALIKQARQLPKELYKSLTWDRGSEMADHKRFTLTTDIQVYFCDPQSPRLGAPVVEVLIPATGFLLQRGVWRHRGIASLPS